MLWYDLSLITIHISDYCPFSDIHISQGSVATYVRCSGIFKYEFVANLLQSLSVTEFWKSVNICRRYGQEFSVLFFLTHGVVAPSLIHNRHCQWPVYTVQRRYFITTGMLEFVCLKGICVSYKHSLKSSANNKLHWKSTHAVRNYNSNVAMRNGGMVAEKNLGVTGHC